MRVLIATVGALLLLVSANPAGLRPASADGPPGASVIAKYRARIPELMSKQGVPGLALALVDGDDVLWTEGFGTTDGPGSPAVTTDTIFSVQSMSKVFTATAVMRAVQAGRLDLDEPIITYLPDFTVHSAFEDHPERKITLRMLLSHTAGFTHEAPVGNNFELAPGTFDAHVRSISNTWLRFPVGRGYAYSNLGIDLAGYILQQVSAKPFAGVMGDTLLAPLGMADSTFDRGRIRATQDRAVGHSRPLSELPVDVPMSAAGGLYASAADLARFLRFQLNGGTIDGNVVLRPALMEEMRTVPEPNPGARAGYALGVARTGWFAGRNADLFTHGGGGFGFLSDLWWLPQLQLGIVVLTNSTDHDLQGELALSILDDLVHEPGSTYAQRLAELPDQPRVIENNAKYQPPSQITALIALRALPASAEASQRWARYSGDYRTPNLGVIPPMGRAQRFVVEGGVAYFEADGDAPGTIERHRLTEIEDGLFISNDGEMLDFRGAAATWRNLDLVRVAGAPATWQWIVLGGIGLISVSWLIGWPILLLKRRRAAVVRAGRIRTSGWRTVAAVTGTLTAILAVAAIAGIVVLPGVVDSGFLGSLDFPLWQKLMLHAPLAVTLAAGCLLALLVAGWLRRWWSRTAALAYAALAFASTVLVALLAGWRLIGFGFG